MSKIRKPKNIRYLHLIVQSLIFIFIAQLAIRHAITPEDQFVASAEAFCPFGGIEALYQFITKGTTIPQTHLSNIVLLGALIATVLITRSSFCGWLCPLGSLQEWIRKLAIKLKIFPKFSFPQKFKKWDRYLQYLKYGVFIWVITATIITGTMIFRDVDPYSTLIKLTSLNITIGLIILGIVLIASLVIERPWCRYLCPLGAFIGILSKISFIKLKRDPELCKSCHLCTKSCPANIQVNKETTISNTTCISCLNCIEACPVNGALTLSVPPIKLKQRLPKIKKSLNKYVYIAIVVVLFFGTIETAKLVGWWSTSGKYTLLGEQVQATGTNPEEIKGWMTLEEVATAYQIPIAEIIDHFKLPSDIKPTEQIKDFEEVGENFSPIELRKWITERLSK